MATLSPAPAHEFPFPHYWSMADLHRHVGVPMERVRLFPPPGTATEDDVLQLAATEGRRFELVDGVLIEKTMGWYESILAGLIVTQLNNYLAAHDVGQALVADAALRILARQIRIPDVAFISWERFPAQRLPRGGIPALIPDLAIEVFSESNTQREMERKRREYLEAGVRLVWFIDPQSRTATVHSADDHRIEVAADGVLDGGEVLPGFRLSLEELFTRADAQGPTGPREETAG